MNERPGRMTAEFLAFSAAAGNDRSPIVERRVQGTSRTDVSAERRRCRDEQLKTGRTASAR